MTNKLKLLSSSFIMALTLAAPLATYAMEPEEDRQAAHAPRHFVRPAYLRTTLDLDQPILEAIYHLTPPLRQFERFLNGKLIYKPNKENDIGKIELRIADLPNPLDGEFDLSKCGDAGKYLSINTGYRKGLRPENKGKVEIWFAPHFLIKNNLEESASHFKLIMHSWDASTAPVGTFFTLGDWDDLSKFDYAPKLSWELYNDPENNLRKIYCCSTAYHTILPVYVQFTDPIQSVFSCHFD